jgi:succinylglutamate desuccinylase
MTDHLTQLQKFLQLQKELLQKGADLGLKTRCPIEYSLQISTDETSEVDIYFSGLIHGNEVIGLYLINEILEQILVQKLRCNLNLLFTLGNIPAFLLGKRFVIRDLNRLFLNKEKNQAQFTLPEEHRAWEMEKMLKDFPITPRAIFDIHQTTAPSETPFLMVREHPATMKWWKDLESPWPLIYYPSGQVFSHEGASLSTLCTEFNIPDITLELGQAGYDSLLFQAAWKLIERMLSFPKTYWRSSLSLEKETNIEQYLIASNGKKNNVFTELAIHQKKTQNHHLIAGLKNFTYIPKNSPISQDGETVMRADSDLYLLFPKYGDYQKSTNELCRFLTPLK